MGCSNPHPHGQIWTLTGTPEEPAAELENLQKYRMEHKGCHLLEDYVKLEKEKKERIVFENDGFLVVCPWWAVWPFETMVIAKRHVRALVELTPAEQLQYAEAIAEVTRRYDNLFETSFPYSKSNMYSRLRSLFCVMLIKFHFRLWNSSSSFRRHQRRNRRLPPTHALLPTAPPFRHGAEIPGWL